MTAANKKPDCPCCKSSRTNKFEYADLSGRDCGCRECGCIWDESKRRAQTAELSTDDYMRLVEWMRSKPRRRANTAFTAGMLRSIAYAVEHAEQPATGSITATCETTSNLPYTVGQTADLPPYGYVMIAEKALRALSPELFKELEEYCRYPLTKAQPAEAVDEAKEREAFEKWCKDNDYATSAPKWAGWLARARGVRG